MINVGADQVLHRINDAAISGESLTEVDRTVPKVKN